MEGEPTTTEAMRKRLDAVSPTFCLAKWYQATIQLQDGATYSCCKALPHYVPPEELAGDPSALHNTSRRKRARRDLRAGARIEECAYCWDAEKAAPDAPSARVALSAEAWAAPGFEAARRATGEESVAPTYLEVGFSGACNFKCSYCHPSKSSSWLEEIERHGPYPTSGRYNNLDEVRRPVARGESNPYAEAFWRWWPDLAPTLRVLRVTGGEPLLAEDLWRLLDELDRSPRPELELSINSNLGVPPAALERMMEKVRALLEAGKIKKFVLYTSVDGWGAQAEYIRHGLDFESFWANARRVLNGLARAELAFMCTFNALSVPSFESFLRGLLELKKEFPAPRGSRVSFDVNVLTYPAHQSVEILTPEFAEKAAALVEFAARRAADAARPTGFDAAEIAALRRVVARMRAAPAPEELRRRRVDFHRFVAEHDRRRGTDFEKTFPELSEFRRLCRALDAPAAPAPATAASGGRDLRPRVLLLTPWPPYPLDGGSKRIHSLSRLLRERFRISLLTFRPRSADWAAAAEDLAREHRFLRPVYENVHWVEPSAREHPERVDGVYLPPDARRFHDPALERRLRELVDGGHADLVHAEFELMAFYARGLAGVPRVLTQHDMGSVSFFNSYFREMSGWGKFARVPEWLRRIRFQREAASWSERVVVMTEADRRTLGRLIPREKIRAVPTGVDLEHFSPDARPRAPVPDQLVYVGHYPHYPNEDAVVQFCRRVLPLIRRRRPGARLLVVGSAPTPAILRLAAEDPLVTVTGTVPDVKPYLEESSVFVAPIRLGHGIKGKILEAFAMGLPVVATSRAAAGLEAEPGRDLLVADASARFADAVAGLLESPERRAELGARGRGVAVARYDWRTLAARLGDVYDELLTPR